MMQTVIACVITAVVALIIGIPIGIQIRKRTAEKEINSCLLYTSDAADE